MAAPASAVTAEIRAASIVWRGLSKADYAWVMLTLIQTAKLNDVDPQAWLADVAGPDRGPQNHRPRCAAALELAPHRSCRPRRLTWRRQPTPSQSAAPSKSSARTRRCCASALEPEDRCVQQTIAFTPAGIECLQGMLVEYKRNRSPPAVLNGFQLPASGLLAISAPNWVRPRSQAARGVLWTQRQHPHPAP